MFFHSPSKNKNIIWVDDYNAFCYEVLEDVIHHHLEHGWTVSHTEEHYQGLKQSTNGIEHGLPFIFRLDMHVVEAPADIKLSEVLGPIELQNKFGDQEKGVLVLDCYGIKRAIVLDQAEQTIFLLDKEDQSSHKEFRGPNLSSVQVFFEEGVELLLLHRGQRVPLERLGF